MAPTPAGSTLVDGRSTRWEAHRRARRDELVDAALRAISRRGPGVGMDDIAAEAGTSKTVLYRHFADKGQLHRAVAARVQTRVVSALRVAVLSTASSPAALGAAITTYLHLVRDDPQVYRFVIARPGLPPWGQPVGEPAGEPADAPADVLADAVAAELARLIARPLRSTGTDERTAAPWAHGLVGLVRAAADAWMAQDPRADADALAAQLTLLVWGGLSAVLDAPGAGPDPLAPADTPLPDTPEPDTAVAPSRAPEEQP